MYGARSYSSVVLLGIYCLLHHTQARPNWDPRMMLTENSTLEDRARYDCPPLQFMRCNDCRPCNDTEKECRSMRKLAARCIDTIGNDTDNDPDDNWSCLEKGQMLGKDQMVVAKQQLLVNCGGGGRVKRKIRRFADFPVTKWDTKIYYKISGTLRAHEAEIIRTAIAMWTKETCLEYSEVPVDMLLTQPHLVFSKVGGWGCYSYIGRSTVIPQPIYLSYNCFSSVVYIAHEIGHSLGLFHEHQRLDRNDYIKIIKKNISPGAEGNFAMVLAKFIEDKNVPYDQASAMHYRAKAFSANGENTVETTNPLYQRTIGQRVQLSFADIKIINLAYCANKCANRPLRRRCENRGYQDPLDCSRCKCPDGLSGTYCEDTKVNGQCGGDLTAIPDHVRSHIRKVKSPGYDRGYYDVGTECSWRITAPQGYQVKLRFRDDFGLYCFSNRCRHWIEVRYNGDLGRTGPRFCCLRTPEEILLSDGNEMLVIFKSIAETKIINLRRGFKFEYYAVRKQCPNSPCRNGATCWQSSPTTQRCECAPNYYGPYCERYGQRSLSRTPAPPREEPRWPPVQTRRNEPTTRPTTTTTTRRTTTTTTRPTTTTTRRTTTTTTRPTTTTTRVPRPSFRDDERADILILLDRSINDSRRKPWHEVTMFVRTLLQNTDLSWNRDRVGVISYAKYANVSVNLGSHSNADGIVDVVQGINLQTQEANPYKALWLMQHEVLRNRNRNRERVPDVAIIITDSNFPDHFPQGIINQGALQARQAGIRILSIGLGDRVLYSTLTALSGHQDNSFILPFARLRDAGIARNIMSRMRYLVRYPQIPETTTRSSWFKRENPTFPRPTTTTRRPTTTTTTTTTTTPTTTTQGRWNSRREETCVWEKAGNCSQTCGGCGRQRWRYYCTRPNGVKTEIASREEPCNEKKCQGWCLRYIGRIYYVPCGPECCGNYKPQGNRCVRDDNYYRQ